MFPTFFIFLSFVLAVLFFRTNRGMMHAVSTSEFWFEKWRDSEEELVALSENYDALDQGNVEIEENYQQEILDYHDKLVTALNAARYWEKTAEELERIRLDHDYSCLPRVGTDIYPTSEEDESPIHDSLLRETCEG